MHVGVSGASRLRSQPTTKGRGMRYRNIAAVAVSTAVVASLAAAVQQRRQQQQWRVAEAAAAAVAGRSPSCRARTTATCSDPCPDVEQGPPEREGDLQAAVGRRPTTSCQDLQQHFQAKDPNYDVVSVDVIWTAQFAAQGLDRAAEGPVRADQPAGRSCPATVKAATYAGNAVRRSRTLLTAACCITARTWCRRHPRPGTR